MLEVLLPVHGPDAGLSSSELSSSELCSNKEGSDSMDSEEAPQLAMEATGPPGGGPLFTGLPRAGPLLAMETTGLPRAGPLFTSEATELSAIEATVTLGLFGAGVP